MDAFRFPSVRLAALLVAGIATGATAPAADPAHSGLGPKAGELTVGPGMNAAGRNLRGSRFFGRDLSGADFSDADLTDVTFEECNLSDARFRGARMSGTALEVCETEGADFTAAVIENRTFYSRLELTPDQLKSTKTFSSKQMSGCYVFSPPKSPGRYNFRGFSIHNCYFTGDYIGSDFTDATIFEVHFPDGIRFEQLATTSSFKQKSFNRVHINGIVGPADFTDVRFADSMIRIDDETVLENTRFVGQCTLQSFLGRLKQDRLRTTYNYRHGDLSRLRFVRIDFSDFDFSGQNLTDAEFAFCTLAGATFEDAVISGARFHTDRGMDMQLTADQIRATWNFKRGRMHDIQLPAPLLESLQVEPSKE